MSNGDLSDLKFNKMSNTEFERATLPFLITSITLLVQSTPEYQKILIHDVDFDKGYNIFRYRSGIQLCSMLANC